MTKYIREEYPSLSEICSHFQYIFPPRNTQVFKQQHTHNTKQMSNILYNPATFCIPAHTLWTCRICPHRFVWIYTTVLRAVEGCSALSFDSTELCLSQLKGLKHSCLVTVTASCFVTQDLPGVGPDVGWQSVGSSVSSHFMTSGVSVIGWRLFCIEGTEPLSWEAVWSWCLARFAAAHRQAGIPSCEGDVGSWKRRLSEHLKGNRRIVAVKLCITTARC